MKKLFTLYVLILPLMLSAQEISTPSLKSSFFALIVKDMDQSLNWYQEKLGFSIINQTELKERGLRQANLSKDDIQLELIELSTAIVPEEKISNYRKNDKLIGIFKMGFTIADFDAWVSYLEKQSIDLSSSIVNDPLSGKKMFIIKDPDGNRLQFFEQ